MIKTLNQFGISIIYREMLSDHKIGTINYGFGNLALFIMLVCTVTNAKVIDTPEHINSVHILFCRVLVLSALQ